LSIGKNTALNFLGAILPLAISLVTIPIYLKLIGEARYGVLAIVWLLLGYFGLFDLGLSRATAQRIGSLRSSTVEQRAIVFWTALSVNLGMGAIAGIIVWPVARYIFGSAVSIDAALRPEIVAAVPWLALSMPIATLSGVLSGALIGRERFLELNIISVVGTAIFQTLPLLAAMVWGPDLRMLLPVALLSRALTLLAFFGSCLRHVCPGQGIAFKRTEAVNLLKFGGWVTITSIVGPLMVTLDRFIIGVVSGATAVTMYTVPFQLAERTTTLARALSNALFPRLSGLDDRNRSLMVKESQRVLLSIMTPLSGLAIILVEPFLSLWISPEFSRNASTVAVIIVAGFWINCLAVVPYSLILARGRPDLIAKIQLAELLPYFLMLYIGLKFLGLPGAAIAFSIRSAVDALLLNWLAGQLRDFMKGLAIPTATICAIALVATEVEPFSEAWLALSAAIIGFATFYASKTLPPTVRAKLPSLLSRAKQKTGA
tara:strand:+ start:473 stop:1933 length:1461 start_codon:yes stop_codon:yes gene_type:complete